MNSRSVICLECGYVYEQRITEFGTSACPSRANVGWAPVELLEADMADYLVIPKAQLRWILGVARGSRGRGEELWCS